ncbi:MAG TPA: AbrB family transcriptional regulator [Acidimicrobiales bacterium]|nr:AbrB family transcriptional regulator [Acidimicrobiales bacterium]
MASVVQCVVPAQAHWPSKWTLQDLLEAELTADGILLRPQKLIDATQAWFWSPEWQAGEREADADQAAGRVETFGSGEEFIGALRSRAKRRRRPSSST